MRLPALPAGRAYLYQQTSNRWKSRRQRDTWKRGTPLSENQIRLDDGASYARMMGPDHGAVRQDPEAPERVDVPISQRTQSELARQSVTRLVIAANRTAVQVGSTMTRTAKSP